MLAVTSEPDPLKGPHCKGGVLEAHGISVGKGTSSQFAVEIVTVCVVMLVKQVMKLHVEVPEVNYRLGQYSLKLYSVHKRELLLIFQRSTPQRCFK